jgi:hypothetical protein
MTNSKIYSFCDKKDSTHKKDYDTQNKIKTHQEKIDEWREAR